MISRRKRQTVFIASNFELLVSFGQPSYGQTPIDPSPRRRSFEPMSTTAERIDRALSAEDMIHVPGGEFLMGSDHHYPEEAPRHPVRVDGFWIDRLLVTNEQFAKFVDATGHVTTAEIAPD